ncbi:MAG: ABC transporter permease [Chloroflexota bacterium]|nr:ABC transporter permease [Chloroflexota bacterium]MDE2668575.1 ABC transporter permease [Chloroflexota bacterium]MXY37073.1 ABC transporter permease [Dehalococcoidia bacterium]
MAQEQSALELEYAIPPRQRFNPLKWARREPFGAFGFSLIVFIVFMSAAAPVLRTAPPNEFAVGPPLAGPNTENWFGTTARGKDVWSRVLFAGRISLKIGVATVLLGTLGGTLIALLSAYAGGAVDFAVGRVADMFIAIPGLLLALVLHSSISADLPDLPGLQREELYLVVAISLFFMPGTYRIMRGIVLELRESTYVEAAQVIGSSSFRIMWRHIAPNMFGLMIVITSISLPAAILAEASLSFLGLGVPIGGLDAVPSWGADLSGSSRRFFSVAPWLAVFPGLALAITVFGFNIFGDSLRDTLDPRLRGRI